MQPSAALPCPRPRMTVETVLTPARLVGAARKLADAELEAVVEGLIAALDARAGEADREPDDGP